MTKTDQARLFKVTLSDWNGAVRGRPSRKIVISAKASLYDLAAVTIESFDFDLDHAFGFYDNLTNWARSEEGYESFADTGSFLFYTTTYKPMVGIYNEINL